MADPCHTHLQETPKQLAPATQTLLPPPASLEQRGQVEQEDLALVQTEVASCASSFLWLKQPQQAERERSAHPELQAQQGQPVKHQPPPARTERP